MKKILFILMGLFLGISNYNASSLDVTLDCPKTAYKGEEITCEVFANTDGITGIQGTFSFDGFELVSETITKNSLFTLPNEFNKLTNKFMVGNTEGLSRYFKLGTITIKSKSTTSEGVYYIELKDIIGSSENHNDINSTDKKSTLLLTTNDDTYKKISKVSNFGYSILFEDKTLFVKMNSNGLVFIDTLVDEVIYENISSNNYEIYYKKENDLYYASSYLNKGPYLIFENYNGDDKLSYYVLGNDLYINSASNGLTDRLVNSEEDCNLNELYSSKYGTCYRQKSPTTHELKSTNIVSKSNNYFVDSNHDLYEIANYNGVLDAYSMDVSNVKSIKYISGTLFILKENNDLYALGLNIFGSKINDGKKITSEPVKIASNIKEYDYDYALTYNNELYSWFSNATRPIIIESDIQEIISIEQIEDKSQKLICYKKNSKIINGAIYIKDGLVTLKQIVEEGTLSYVLDHIDGEPWVSFYVDKDGNIRTNFDWNVGIIDTNVKQIFQSKDESNIMFYIKNDGNLYLLCGYGESSLKPKKITENIIEYKDGILKTKDNHLLTLYRFSYYDGLDLTNFYEDENINTRGIYIKGDDKRNVNVGDKIDFEHIFLPSNNTNKNVIYTSSNPSVVSVSEDGLMTALSFGTALVRVTSLDTLVYSEIEVSVNPTEKPSTPALTTSVSGTSVTISWNKANNAVNYEIYRSTDNKTFTKLSTTSDLSYIDTNVKMGYTYYYKVRSVNDLGTSAYSSTKSVKVLVTKTTISVNDSNYSYITLSWNKISGIKGYKIYRSTKKDSGYKLIKTITSYKTTSFKDTGVSQGTKYYYKVLVYTVVNKKDVNSSYSNTVTITPKIKDLTTLKVTKNTSNSLKLTWSKVSGATSYDVYKCDGSCKKIQSTTSRSYTMTGLTLGKNYKVGVRACRKYSGKTVCSSIKYIESYVYPSKSNLTITNDNDSITINIKKISGATYYILKYKEKEESEYSEIKLTDLTYTFDSNIGKTYDFKLVVYKEVNEDVILDSLESSISYTLKPLTPSGFKATLTKVGSITLSWNYEEGYIYKVYRSTSKTSGYKYIKTLEESSYVDTGLKKGTTYYYKIRAYKNGVYSDYSIVRGVKNSK